MHEVLPQMHKIYSDRQPKKTSEHLYLHFNSPASLILNEAFPGPIHTDKMA